MMYSGENELADSIASVRAQQGVETRIDLIGGYGQVEAHRKLYSLIDAGRREVCCSVKLDADMVIADDYVLKVVADAFASYPAIDRITIDVDDFLTRKKIGGCSFFSSTVRFLPDPHPLRADTVLSTVVNGYDIDPSPGVWIRHAPDQSDDQVVRWAAQRTLKALALGPQNEKWDFLVDLLAAARDEPHPRRSLALATVAMALDPASIEVAARALDNRLETDDLDRVRGASIIEAMIEGAGAVIEDPHPRARACHDFSTTSLAARLREEESARRRRLRTPRALMIRTQRWARARSARSRAPSHDEVRGFLVRRWDELGRAPA